MDVRGFFGLFLVLNSVPAASTLCMPSFVTMGNEELALIEERSFLTSAAILDRDLSLTFCHYYRNCWLISGMFFQSTLKKVRYISFVE